jgi:hypothetical protein
MDALIDEIIAGLNFSSVKGRRCVFSGKGYSPVDFSPSNFSEIMAGDGEITFVDGGSGEIFSAVNFSLAFFRVYFCTYSGSAVKSSGKQEFFAVISASGKGGGIEFRTRIFGSELFIPVFSQDDAFLSGSSSHAGILKILDLVRRTAEIELASKLSGYVVLDGNLRADNEFVQEKLGHCRLYALSKTNELLTDSGNSLTVELDGMAPFRQWMYYPVVKIDAPLHKAEIVVVKLHPSSKYVFKLETPVNDDFKIVGVLASNAKDPVFLGYPFGLVQADRFARVSNEELGYLRMKFLARNEGVISQYLNTMNAHGILDRVL